MTQTILCAVDINRPDAEKQVVPQAQKLATLDNAQLDVITVVPDFGASIVGTYFKDHDIETAQDGAATTLNDMIAGILGKDANATVRHIVAIGTVY